jgi:hypothetical protein
MPTSHPRRNALAKVLRFARKPPVSGDPNIDVCLTKGERRRRYVIAPVSASTWESRVEDDERTEQRCLLSRPQAERRRAELELRIATELGAGWTLKWNR